jgi:hypothetical protein
MMGGFEHHAAEGKMNRSALVAAAIVLGVGCGPAFGQAGISKFDEVAGQWTGHASRHGVTLDIDATGKFTAKSALGSETGNARLDGGTLMIPLPEHNGALQLIRQGEALKGFGVLSGKTWEVSLRRAER